MRQDDHRIIEHQRKFFNKNAELEKPSLTAPLLQEYVNKEQRLGFEWLLDRKRILDYGCGTGTSIDAFIKIKQREMPSFIGVDIADLAIQRVKQRYPYFTFYTIDNNRIPLLQEGSVDGAYLLHVLHHSHDHDAIFREIYSKLQNGGKFFLSDLSSNNPIIRLFRNIFIVSPRVVKKRFSDDLVVDGGIPDKYKVDAKTVIAKLKDIGFTVQEVGYGHWALFLFVWLDRFIPFSRFILFRLLFKALESLETRLLKYRLFYKHAEVFYIKCVK